MDSLRDYEAFVAVIESGSLSAAARSLKRSLQSVSRSLRALEDRLGVTLVRRTTRYLAATEAGLACYRRLQGALNEIKLAECEAKETAETISGPLRVSASTLFGSQHVLPALSNLMRRHPEITLSLCLDDEFTDPIPGGFDVAVRLGELPSSSLVARRLATMRRVAFASPAYLTANGAPERPEDLVGHQCLVRLTARRPRTWTFTGNADNIEVTVSGRFESNSAQAVNAAAAKGLGVAIAPLWQIAGLIRAGEVEVILQSFEPPPTPLHAVWPASAGLSAKTRSVVEALAAHCRAEDW